MDRALIIDLKRLQFLMTKKKKSKQMGTTQEVALIQLAIKDFGDMHQLVDPERFVCSEVNIEHCRTE